MKKKLRVINLKMNGLSWYRSQGVLRYIENEVPNLEITFTGDSDSWHDLMMQDIYYMPRPQGSRYLQNIYALKNLKKSIWIDWDDDFMSLPTHHPSYRAYSNPNELKATIEIIKLADVVTVSTKYLLDLLKPYNENILLVRNAFNDYFHEFKKTPIRTSDIYWRGSQFHRGDLYSFKDQMSSLIEANSNRWVFNGGDDFWFLHLDSKDHIGKMHHEPAKDVISYMSMLTKYNPLLVHVPLEDNKFNRSKSNIALIEACLAGTIPVCPDWEEWLLDGALNYSNASDYLTLIQNVIRGEVDIEKQYSLLVESIKDTLVLSKENKKRIELINNL